MIRNKAVFARYWDIPLHPLYHITKLPGRIKGLSGSFCNGYYLIMNKKSEEAKKIATGKVIEFMLSKDVQLKYLEKEMKLSGMFELYDDERCYKPYCDIFKNLQFIRNAASLVAKQGDLSNKIKYYSTEFIYGNITAEETLLFWLYLYQSISDMKLNNEELKIKKEGLNDPKRKSRISTDKGKRSIKDKILDIHYSSHDVGGESSSTKEPMEIVLYTGLILSDEQTDISSEGSR
ncbi:hypothetical protein PIROE2DRAFT_17055 [Piromyces sp. E2]|nr:hypothetical protein PIROE2DRAFT_17055 [Piromyces sp. E2]|eukprot:OUM57837.1 hypothetical protein PIROE2DRAFT_17055 [Piromyces sp. E2]